MNAPLFAREIDDYLSSKSDKKESVKWTILLSQAFIQLVEDEVLITISLQGRDVADSFDSLESRID